MSARIRVGTVDYLNAKPLVRGLEQGLLSERIELSYHIPAELSDRMRAGTIDIGLLPVIELARMPELEVVPGLAIGTHGPARSVLLVSRVPVERIHTLALDTESRTSNILAQVLLAMVWQRDVQVLRKAGPLDTAPKDCDAVVRIGDKALFEEQPAGWHTYDLGQVWTEATGLPFVFAAWSARPGLLDRELYRGLHASQRAGRRALDEIADEYVWRERRRPEVSRRYLHENIRYRLGGAEMLGLRRFLEAAAAMDLIDAVPPLHMALRKITPCHETVPRESATGSSRGSA